MERWKTISRNDPEFFSYLEGRFSDSHRALPTQSLNVGTSSELVTFEIVPVTEIQRPSALVVIWQALRPQTLMLSAGPMLAALCHVLASPGRGLPRLENWAVALFAFCGVLAFHASFNLMNDYGDHLRGRDRIRARGGSRVIQRGWIAAGEIKRAALLFLGFAIFFGVLVVVASWGRVNLAVLLALAFALLALEFAFQRLRLTSRGWAEVFGFVLTGPALIGAYSWVVTGSLGLADLSLGAVYGALSLMYFHSVNFENIMIDSQAGLRTWATRTGFEASQRFFHFTALLIVVSVMIFVFGFARDLRLLPLVMAVAAMILPLVRRVQRLASPLSSQLSDLRLAVLWVLGSTTLLLMTSFLVMALQE